MTTREQLENYLKKALNNEKAGFRAGQWESIESLLNGERALVVQRTGWGKSMVYFLTTKYLREKGAGPTLLISPLLSLIRNQLEWTRRIGLVARSINSSNTESWPQIQREIDTDQVDLLLISPERLANDDFQQNVLANISDRIGLLAIDEAHCISDWGHDFRPDYRRIARILRLLPPNLPVIATTATANDRVVNDIKSQLGGNITVQRGPLVRDSLKLQNIYMPLMEARMAWLAKIVPQLPGSGIIYTLTQRDAEILTEWLRLNGIEVMAYHAALPEDGLYTKETLEQMLLRNEVKALVATVALGMGFDKPDLGFVIHFQRPASVVHYYQQVGRAGISVSNAYGIMLCGREDDQIADYFIQSAFPPQNHIADILKILRDAEDGLTVRELQKTLNLRYTQIEKALKFLSIESPAPIIRQGYRWYATAQSAKYKVNQDYIDKITAIRRGEQEEMRQYMRSSKCLMAFLQNALNDPQPVACGHCANCDETLRLDESYPEELFQKAESFLRSKYQILKPKKQWPDAYVFSHYPFSGLKISQEHLAEEGRALALWRDSVWGELVAQGKYQDGRFSDELVMACVTMLRVWSPRPAPKWVTCIPSLKRPDLVPDFAARLAKALGLTFYPLIEKVKDNPPQKEMNNSYQQARNLDGVFVVAKKLPKGPCLLIDDVVNSGWTLTVAAALLRNAGCPAVYPLALALNTLNAK